MNEEDKIHINSFKFYDRDELEELTKEYYLENKQLKKEKQELIDYLKEQINERKLTGNDEDYIKLDVYEEILSKIEKSDK